MQGVYDQIKILPFVRKIPVSRLRLFCIDISLVASGIRLAYLCDAFSFSSPLDDPSQLITHLRKIVPEFMSVVHVHDARSDQSFFVNTHLLKSLHLNEPDSLRSFTLAFINLADSRTAITEPPLNVTYLLSELYASLADKPNAPTVQLATETMSNYSHASIVPLAATLLEYPVAYVPPPTQSAFLADVPLEVYECTIDPTFTSTASGSSSWIPKQHTLFKFSCPCPVAEQYPHLRPGALKSRITDHFTLRVFEAGIQAVVTTSHHTETHDRVAL